MTIRAVCGAFGPEFAKSAIAPLFVASATLDAFQAQAAVPQHVARLVQSFVFEVSLRRREAISQDNAPLLSASQPAKCRSMSCKS